MNVHIVKFKTRDYDLLERWKQYLPFVKTLKYIKVGTDFDYDIDDYFQPLEGNFREISLWEFWFDDIKDATYLYELIILQNEMPDQILDSSIEFAKVFDGVNF